MFIVKNCLAMQFSVTEGNLIEIGLLDLLLLARSKNDDKNCISSFFGKWWYLRKVPKLGYFCGRRNKCPKISTILEEYLLPFLIIAVDDDIILPHDNTPTHAGASTKTFFEHHWIKLLKRPTLSSNHNPIQNLWPILGTTRQNSNVELQKFGKSLKKIIESVSRKRLEFINSNGKSTTY